MKTKFLHYARCFSVLSLTYIIGFAISACNDSDDEPTVDAFLSNETTPIDFVLPAGTNILFDYNDDRYLGSDTIVCKTKETVTINLRRGKHRLVWFNGLGKEDYKYEYATAYNESHGVFFQPETQMIECDPKYPILSRDIWCAQQDIEVTEYLMAPRKLEYTAVTSRIHVKILDVPTNTGWEPPFIVAGIMRSQPFISAVSLNRNDYVAAKETWGNVYILWDNEQLKEIVVDRLYTLCPKNGLDNIQLIPELVSDSGELIPTTPLPKICIQRGCASYIGGALFTGSTSDWLVSRPEPYNE